MLMTHVSFNFQNIADGLNIQVRIRPAHQQQTYQQMIQRFEQTGGKVGMGMPMRIAAMMLIGVGLVGTVVVIHEVRSQKSEIRSTAIREVQHCIDTQDVAGLVSFIDHDLPVVQIKAITGLGQMGDVTALAALTALLETPITEVVRTATLVAIDQLRQRLNVPSRSIAPNQPVETIQAQGQDELLFLAPDQQRSMDVVINGVEATAQLELPTELVGLDFENSHFSIHGRPNLEAMGVTDMKLELPDKLQGDWYSQWIETDAGQDYQCICDQVKRIEEYSSVVTVFNTGLLQLEEVPPGDYWLYGTFMDDDGNDLARVRCALTVPEGRDFANLGTLVTEQVPFIEIGQSAPPLSLFTLDGAPVTLDRFRGQYLVLDLGFNSYRGSSYAQDYVPVLQRVANMDDVEILSVDASWGFSYCHHRSPYAAED